MKNHKTTFIFVLLTLISLPTFKRQVKIFEIYIIPKKPDIPVLGKNEITKSILKTESNIEFLKQNFCWSRPFKIPSHTLSRYISGTIGERAHSKKPTSSLP